MLHSLKNEQSRPTWADIDLDALAFNLRSTRKFMGPDVEIMAMVKADAYGHGAVQCSERLEQEDVDWFGVALIEEGVELRRSGIRKPILCVGGIYAGDVELVLSENITPVIYHPTAAEQIDQAARSMGLVANIHVKIDTGMGRVGVRFDEVEEFSEKLLHFKHLNVEGLMTHFAAADDLSENEFTGLQMKRFNEAVDLFKVKGFKPKYVDLANSPGAVAHPSSRGNLVRLGGILYGLGDDVLPKGIPKPELRPVMSLFSMVAHLKHVPAGETFGYHRTFRTDRDSVIATIPIGYEDGYRRALSNKSRVIINKTFAPVIGRISMDWTIVDVTDVPGVQLGSIVIVIGSGGDLRISVEDLAEAAHTISYEITCGINRRVKKQFVAQGGTA